MMSSSATASAKLLTLSPASPSPSSYYSSLFTNSSNVSTLTHKHTKVKLTSNNDNNNIVVTKHSLQCLCNFLSTSRFVAQYKKSHALSDTLLTASVTATPGGAVAVADKLNDLSSEFNCLSEPIDRVKRLLHYAAMLPPLDESERVPANRVVGCSTQVWLVAEMDEGGRMRFRADSDSEISKGFCWCLVWMLDGAEPQEVLRVEKEDLVDVNVGLNVKAQSRVNTWQNVLFAMQKATKDLVLEMEEKAFPSLIVTPHDDDDDIVIPPKGKFSGISIFVLGSA